MLWQNLIARADPELQALIELMGTQHEVVAGCLQRCLPARQAWAATADHDAGAELAGLYDRLAGPLLEHLDAEETRMMPAAAKPATVGEWAAIAEAGRSASKGRESLLSFGMIGAEAPPEAIAGLLGNAPRPVRFMLPRLAARTYRTHLRQLRLQP